MTDVAGATTTVGVGVDMVVVVEDDQVMMNVTEGEEGTIAMIEIEVEVTETTDVTIDEVAVDMMTVDAVVVPDQDQESDDSQPATAPNQM